MLKRTREIVNVLARNGFHTSLLNLKLIQRVPKKTAKTPTRVVQALEQLGPVFVKLGFFLSTRPDIIPPKYCKAFEKLHCKTTSFPVIKGVIEASLQKEIPKIFTHFDKTPLIVDPFYQIHTARMKKEVLVRVLQPGLHKQLKKELPAMNELARFSGYQNFFDEFVQYIDRETNTQVLKHLDMEVSLSV